MHTKKGNNKPARMSQTFFNLLTLDGGHWPLFLILLLWRSFFLLSRIFLENFILSFCSSFSCSLESSGRLLNIKSSSSSSSSTISESDSTPSKYPESENALTTLANLSSVRTPTPSKFVRNEHKGLMCNPETGNQSKQS